MGQLQAKQFVIVLTNQSKLWALFSGVVVLWLVIVIAGDAILSTDGSGVHRMWVIPVLGGVFASLIFIVKQTAEPTQITVGIDSLRILTLKSQVETSIIFESIAAYRFTSFFPEHDFVLQMKDGSKLNLFVNTRIHETNGLYVFMHQFKKALHRRQSRFSATEVYTPVEEKALTFFEMPQGTVCLIAALIFISAMVWAKVIRHIQLGSSFLPVYIFLGVYVVVWLAIRIRRLWFHSGYQQRVIGPADSP